MNVKRRISLNFFIIVSEIFCEALADKIKIKNKKFKRRKFNTFLLECHSLRNLILISMIINWPYKRILIASSLIFFLYIILVKTSLLSLPQSHCVHKHHFYENDLLSLYNTSL